MQGKNIIKARAIIPIYYSTVTNTSKKLSYMLQDKLEQQNFLSTITNIGDVNTEQFLQQTGPVIMIMSTYGNGGSPADGDDFIQWLRQLQKKNYFENIELCILGLGNRSFQHFCGNSKTIRQLMIHNGAKQLVQLVTCNSSSQDECAMQKFPQWSNDLISKLKQKYELKQINAQQLLQKYKVVTKPEIIQQDAWLNQYENWSQKLSKQFMSYHKSSKAQVIHIKQLRQKNDGRSTLWIRLKCPQGFRIEPACNISVYPQNVRKQGQKLFQGSISIQSSKKNTKIPYPPMPLQSLWKISNFNQIADLNLIKYAITLSKSSAQVKAKYQHFLKNPQDLEKNPIRCYQLYQDLNPGLEFVVKLGINSVRAYTLASWTQDQKYFDLVASLDPLGLTSKYFASRPSHIKILPTQSTFYVPSGRPVVMIANGSGIAPFRSLTQYFLQKEQASSLTLYFGIQNKELDYYFKQEWQNLQKEGKIKLRIAESRSDPEKKVYVQDLIKQDRQLLCKHLFQHKGVIFICGSSAMSKSVDTEIFESIKKHQPIPFKAFKLHTELIKNKTIVKEVFS